MSMISPWQYFICLSNIKNFTWCLNFTVFLYMFSQLDGLLWLNVYIATSFHFVTYDSNSPKKKNYVWGLCVIDENQQNLNIIFK